MTLFDILFWLLILLIALLAYVIESGLSARHRTLVLSSILSATVAAIYMMFLIDDNSAFGTGERTKTEEGEDQVAGGAAGAGGGSGGAMGAGPAAGADGGGPMEVQEAGPAGESDGEGGIVISRYEDGELLKTPGGFRDCPVCPLMIMVEDGRALVGSPDSEPDRRANEGPQIEVRFGGPFAVSRYEILKQEFAAFVEETKYVAATGCVVNGETRRGSDWRDPGFPQPTADYPVVCISRVDAEAYAGWLSSKTERIYRLLSESEWEYVARAGTESPYWQGVEIRSEQAYFAAEKPGAGRAGQFDPNAFKLFDTAGNVWEMTADCWLEDLTDMSEAGRAYNPAGLCAEQTVRGGGWRSPAAELRAAFRRPVNRAFGFDDLGLRLAREIK